MANPFEKLAPEGFVKIAQNDNMNGQVLAVVYHNKNTNEFFVQALGTASEFITFGPMKAHIFDNLMKILSDVKDMDKKYFPLE